jgi:hypothetical protein
MAQRGRGLLEVKPSNNPFMQSTSADLGVNPYQKVEWSGDHDPAMTRNADGANRDTFSFLYARESDNIGGRVAKPTNEKPRLLTKTEFLKKRREELRAQMTVDEVAMQNAVEPTYTVEEILTHYKHEPKSEDPRFMTTSVSTVFAACGAVYVLLSNRYVLLTE